MTLARRCLPSQTTKESLPDLVWRPRYHASRCRDIPVFWLKRTHLFYIGHGRLSFIRIECLTLICVQKITKNNHWHRCYLLTQKVMRLSTGSEHLPKTKLFCAFEHYLSQEWFVYDCLYRIALTSHEVNCYSNCPTLHRMMTTTFNSPAYFTIMRKPN